jgi:hypothetical protein
VLVAPNEVHVWWADYRLADDVWRDFLDRQERERFEAYRREADRLRAALAELEVTPAHEVPRVEAWPLRRDLVGRIQIHDLDPDDSHRASVAVIGAPPLPVIRHPLETAGHVFAEILRCRPSPAC